MCGTAVQQHNQLHTCRTHLTPNLWPLDCTNVSCHLGATSHGHRTVPRGAQGPTSSGKTSLVAHLAAQTGHEFVRINNHQGTDLQVHVNLCPDMRDWQ